VRLFGEERKQTGSTWVHRVGTGPWALNSSMDGFAQKLHHFSGGRAFTKSLDDIFDEIVDAWLVRVGQASALAQA
jgi:hypothetical protein